MPNTAPRHSTRPAIGSPAPAPAALRVAPVVVAGSGPVGSLCALMLAQRGMKVILIDRVSDPALAVTSRSWTVALNGRAERVLETVPGLMDRIKAVSIESRSLRLDSVEPDGGSKVLNIKLPEKEPPFRWILRPQLIHAFTGFAKENKDIASNIEFRYDTTVTEASFNADGTTTLDLLVANEEEKDKKECITAKLVIACDGKNSPILAALRADKSKNLTSSCGFEERAWNIPSSSKVMKSIIVKKEVRDFVREKLPEGREWPEWAGFMLSPETKSKRPACRTFSVGSVVTKDGPGAPGKDKILASMMVQRDSKLLSVRSVEEGYALFEENFPHVDVRQYISKESMEEFVRNPDVIPFGPARRPASIVGRVGGSDLDSAAGGAVLLAGDVAHSFPPDIGQGLNTGLEDVGVIMGLIDGLSESDSVRDLAEKYDDERDHDIDGVIFLHRFGARWQFGQPMTLGGLIWLAGIISRALLSTAAPAVFKLPVVALMGQDIAFGEAMKMAQTTTRRIWIGVAALAFFVARGLRRRAD